MNPACTLRASVYWERMAKTSWELSSGLIFMTVVTHARAIEKGWEHHRLLLELLLSVVNEIKHVANFCFYVVQYYHFCVSFDTAY